MAYQRRYAVFFFVGRAQAGLSTLHLCARYVTTPLDFPSKREGSLNFFPCSFLVLVASRLRLAEPNSYAQILIKIIFCRSRRHRLLDGYRDRKESAGQCPEGMYFKPSFTQSLQCPYTIHSQVHNIHGLSS